MPVDPKMYYVFDIKFNCGQKNVTLTFPHAAIAITCQRKSPGSALTTSTEGNHVHLPPLEDLDYIRSGHDHARELVLVFLNKDAATTWAKSSPLALEDGKGVRLKGKWKSEALMKVLGMRKDEFFSEEKSYYSVMNSKFAPTVGARPSHRS